MQTFLPYADISKSAQVLDYRRLGKQRVETKQILMALDAIESGDLYMTDKRGRKRKRGWVSHPCTSMWRGHKGLLSLYGLTMCLEWRKRGYNDSLLPWFAERLTGADLSAPAWWGWEDLHYSHRCNLVRKDFTHYAPIFADADPDVEYVWPTPQETRA